MGVLPSAVAALVTHRQIAGVAESGLRFLAGLASSVENKVTLRMIGHEARVFLAAECVHVARLLHGNARL
jgi:hypothetical protein